MITVCIHCGKEIATVYDIPYRFCVSSTCRQDYIAAKQELKKPRHQCEFCGHSWILRGTAASYCPKCKKSGIPKAISALTQEIIACQNCGEPKLKNKVKCEVCRRSNTELTHYMGMTIRQWEDVRRFLQKYVGPDQLILNVKNLVEGNVGVVLPKLEPKAITSAPIEVEAEEVELSAEELAAELDRLTPQGMLIGAQPEPKMMDPEMDASDEGTKTDETQ